MTGLLATVLLLPTAQPAVAKTGSASGKATPPNVLFIVGDDVGYNDFGFFNDKKAITPTIDGLLEDGIFLSDYYTFKICSPSRAAMTTGRYPWGAGFYNMAADSDHCTTNSTALPQLLKPLGYKTHALGKWDVGYLKKECSPTYRGFDTFFGYYLACEADYWYHTAPGCQTECMQPGDKGIGKCPVDLSNNTGPSIKPSALGLNGTYNTQLLANEAARLVLAHDVAAPFYMYLAFMAVHDGCGDYAEFLNLGKQAPKATVDLYGTTVLDTYKVAGAMYTELDSGIQVVIDALKTNSMWENTVLIFVSDNGGPLDHCTNEPLRGGKHTFFEGGVRVMAFVSGPLIPASRRGTRWNGMAASADWYEIIPVGIARGPPLPDETGYRPPDAINLWTAIIDGASSPRTEVVHQVENQWSCDITQPGGGCVSSMRMGEMKLIIGGPGDSRTVEKPEVCVPVKPPAEGYLAPCPHRGFIAGCEFACGAASNNCQECYNGTAAPLFTESPAQCQAACALDRKCGAFLWTKGSGRKHACIFKCPGCCLPGRAQCSLGHTSFPGQVCGPKRNDSAAPEPPGPPPTPPPTAGQACPVPFGLTGGIVEVGTDHARAIGLKGTVTELVCKPWCLFNLTDDIGERNDLGSNPVFQAIAQKIAARLKYHASTGPMPAYIWSNMTEFKEKTAIACAASKISGYTEPIDVNGKVTLLD